MFLIIANNIFLYLYLISFYTECTGETQSISSTEGVSCEIDSECQTLSVCVESEMLMRNFLLSFNFDACEVLLTISIENFARKYSLTNLRFDGEHLFDLFGLVKIRYVKRCMYVLYPYLIIFFIY